MAGQITRFGTILLGSVIASVAVNGFLIPHRLLSGGVSGIAIMIEYLTGIPAGVLFLILNIPIFIFGYSQVDRDFITASLAGMSSLSLFLVLTKGVGSFLTVDDTMLASIFGGVIFGLGVGLAFRSRGSQGGIDIIAVVLRRRYSMNIGSVLMGINAVIIVIASALYGIKPGMFTLIAMFISSLVVDRVQEGFDRKKSVFIVTDKYQEIAGAILRDLHRGATFLLGEGAFTRGGKKVIYCIVTVTQLARLKHIVESIDKEAFMTVSDAAEVLGKGFRNPSI
ncbi:MAG: YitT family protein [Actinobacteria bacterium]|nr:YitT family protein [Actinomycetota bacterium]